MARKRLLQITLSLIMLGLIIWQVDVSALIKVASHVSLITLVLFSLGYLGTQLIAATKWWLLLRSTGFNVSWSRTASSCLLGMYLNCFGLGTVGGDIARGLTVVPETSQVLRSFCSVVADRLLGLAVLAAIGIVGFSLNLGGNSPTSIALVAGAIIAVSLVMVLALPHLKRRLARNPGRFQKVEQALSAMPDNGAALLPVLGVSAIFHLTQISLFLGIVWVLGASVPIKVALMAIPFSNIMATLPLSWMGLGIRESAYIFFFVPAFLTPEQATAAALTWFAAMTIASALGGLIAVTLGELEIPKLSSGYSYGEKLKQRDLVESR